MKNLLWVLMLVAGWGCGPGEGKKNNGYNEKNEDPANTDTVVWVGIFARWMFNERENYDGSYDTVSKIFVMCSNNQAIEVPREQIIFQVSGYCDTAAANRVKLMIKKTDSVKIIINRLKVIDSKGIYKINNQERSIPLNEKTLERIKQNSLQPANRLPGRASGLVPVTAADSQRIRLRPYTLKDTVAIRKVRPGAEARH